MHLQLIIANNAASVVALANVASVAAYITL